MNFGPSPPTSMFKFDSETHRIKVENISSSASPSEVVALFSTLVGPTKVSRNNHGRGSRWTLELEFHTQDVAKKALCMSGYTVAGQPITVIPTTNSQIILDQVKKTDNRRNLYVLGLPFDLTKNEFAEVFSQCGTVSHCVILATCDNSSRRRGFVVMSTHEEAKVAMKRLTRTQIKGHTIDVSWAVVQRSQGFLDGGDRIPLLDSQPPTALANDSFDFSPVTSCFTSRSSSSQGMSCAGNPFMGSVPPTLLVTNLPTLLFSQTQDLDPLVRPFGTIKKLELIDSSTLAFGKISAVVEYVNATSAQDAKEALHGQLYAGFVLHVEYVYPAVSPQTFSPPINMQIGPSEKIPRLATRETGPALNPFASPFVFDFAQLYAPPYGYPSGYHVDSNAKVNYCGDKILSSGLVGTQHSTMHLPPSGFFNFNHFNQMSRSSSANSRLSVDSDPRPLPHEKNAALRQFTAFNTASLPFSQAYA